MKFECSFITFLLAEPKGEDGMKSLCQPDTCHNGGTCEEHDNIFSCYCAPGFAGDVCQHNLRLKSSGSVHVAGFDGASSLVAALTPQDSVNRFEIRLSLKILNHDGIILFTKGDEDLGESDFLSLAVIDR